MMETLVYEQRGHVGWLALNRPDKLNALTFEMWDELTALGTQLRAEGTIRALVIIGAGRAFCAGADLSVLAAAPGAEGGHSTAKKALAAQEAFTWIAESGFPTIAAVRGPCYGGGLELALTCDLRVVADTARFALPEVKLGFVPDLGGCIRLPMLVGEARAKDLVWTGREFGAEEAWRLGVADRLVPDADLEQAVGDLAQELADLAPLAVTHAKRLVDGARHASVRDGLRATADAVQTCIDSDDCAEALRALAENRTPHYRGR